MARQVLQFTFSEILEIVAMHNDYVKGWMERNAEIEIEVTEDGDFCISTPLIHPDLRLVSDGVKKDKS